MGDPPLRQVDDAVRVVVALIVLGLGVWAWQVPPYRFPVLIVFGITTIAYALFGRD